MKSFLNSIALFVCLILMSVDVNAGRLHTESYYQELDCSSRQGETEVVLQDRTRVDCLTKELAIEHDFANKWYECISQSLYYAMHTGRTASCGLIIEQPSESKYLNRANRLIRHYGLPVELYPLYP